MLRFRRRVRTRPITLRRKTTYALVVAIPILAILTFSNRGILKRVELEHRSSSLRDQLYLDRAIGDSIRREIETVRSDSSRIEALAREKYGMVRPGETLYRTEE